MKCTMAGGCERVPRWTGTLRMPRTTFGPDTENVTLCDYHKEFYERLAKGRKELSLSLTEIKASTYHLKVLERSGEFTDVLIDEDMKDPFITLRILPGGWRRAWDLLRGKLEYIVMVDADPSTRQMIAGSETLGLTHIARSSN